MLSVLKRAKSDYEVKFAADAAATAAQRDAEAARAAAMVEEACQQALDAAVDYGTKLAPGRGVFQAQDGAGVRKSAGSFALRRSVRMLPSVRGCPLAWPHAVHRCLNAWCIGGRALLS